MVSSEAHKPHVMFPCACVISMLSCGVANSIWCSINRCFTVSMPLTCIGSNKADDMHLCKKENSCFENWMTSLFSDIEGFSKGFRTTNSNLTSATNLNRSKQSDEPIRILSDYLEPAHSAGKTTRTKCDWFWFCFSLVENWRETFKPITRRSNRNRVITFDSQFNTALGVYER